MSQCFVFRKELLDIAEALEVCGKGLAGEFLVAAAQYGLTNEYTSTNPVILTALENAKEFFPRPAEKSPMGGRPTNFDPYLITDMVARGYTNKEVAEHFGCSIRTVQRALKKIN